MSVATLAYEYPSRFQVPEHAHGSDQLIYAISGLMEVSSGQSIWVIPPHFALWIPARTRHRIHMAGPVSMRTLYLRAGLTARLEPRCCAVLHVTPLLRELIVETVRLGQLRVRNRYEYALRDLLISQLQRASPLPTFVTMPREARALAIAQRILRDPAESKAMAALCAEVGVSVRTIERVFLKELGIGFESWRRQVRLTKAVELLVSGSSIKEVAYTVGYCQPSAFVEMFRRTLGTTPKAWIIALESLGHESTNSHTSLPLPPLPRSL
ncbi:Transcriptional regulator, AraC family [Acidisarcina polymorpha]|uniref:Transcriptional regulator, AraC family n=1 Tax=Acidisarcina polymorpha TaxID=2211140 RepID=A0A2Z5G3L2_9BACT|nr:helix-turn-helix transcriptional regulator [Acidisarcina polymorpha]AXC13698.1 Transcriptional regulator, AraC family [Acidisarcina polymorpha]